MIALHFEGLLSQQWRNFTVLWCSNQFRTAERKQRSTLQVIQSATAVACFYYRDYKLNAMRCKGSFFYYISKQMSFRSCVFRRSTLNCTGYSELCQAPSHTLKSRLLNSCPLKNFRITLILSEVPKIKDP